ncbi:MAG: flagellar hook-basal body complex protein, partial [Alphaproteobacteria bacterium]|nr:flagellar hook-basal body complex protein [Alphaproteobacteria bacterium]
MWHGFCIVFMRVSRVKIREASRKRTGARQRKEEGGVLMENLTYIGLSQEIALNRQMNMVANNIANMSTPGYKSEGVLFKQYITQAPQGGEKVSEVQESGTYRDLTEGPLTNTSNKLDAAIDGAGYFAVMTPQGIRYTRDGSFSLNGSRELVTKQGYPVMDVSDNPLTLQPGATGVNITSDGHISTSVGPVGQLKVATFTDPQALKAEGGDLYSAGNMIEQPADSSKVLQGML